LGEGVAFGVLVDLGEERSVGGEHRCARDEAGIDDGTGPPEGEQPRRVDGNTLSQVIALAYPVGDLMIVSTAVALLARRVEGWRGAIGIVIAGVVALAVADSSFAYFVSSGSYTDGPTDAGWAIGFLLIGYAAALRPVAQAESPAVDRPPTVVEAALPMIPVGIASVVLVTRAAAGQSIGPFLGITLALVGLFVVARTLIIQVENARLTSDLALTVEALELREDELHHQAFHDAHTGLANRALFRDRLEHAVARRAGQEVVVLFIDLDDFKTVNDSLGHDVGDHLLVLVAERLRACVRPGDTVARLGGDEFGVLVDESDAADHADHLARRILAAFEVPFAVAGRQLRVQASVGVALGSTGTSTAAGLLQDADLAMYAAKAAGKATSMRFHPSLRDEATDRMELIHDLNHALEHHELEIHYQPVLQLPERQRTGYAALVRWRHPIRGLLPAEAFMDLAEETGAAVPIGWWLLEQACQTVAGAQTTADGGPRWLSVSLSPRQLRDPAVAGTVAAILSTTGFDPSALILRLTEASVLEGDEIIDAMRELRALGVRLSVDSFGTGYSSLSVLAALPLDGVKIDKSFVARMEPDGEGDGDVLIRAVTQLADGLGLRVIAEGVEHEFQLERLTELGCTGALGPLIGAPEPTLDGAAAPAVTESRFSTA